MKFCYLCTLYLGLLFSGLLQSFSARGQDVTFSQSYFSPIYVNPASTGRGDGARISMLHRQQWTRVPGPFQTTHANFDAPIDFGYGESGIGLGVFRNEEGEGFINTSGAHVLYAYHRPLRHAANRFQLNMHLGLSYGFRQRSIAWDRLVFSDQLDPDLGVVAGSSPGAARPRETYQMQNGRLGGMLTASIVNNGITQYFAMGYALNNIFSTGASFYGEMWRPELRHTFHAAWMRPLNIGNQDKQSYLQLLAKYDRQKDFQLSDLLGIYFTKPALFGLGYKTIQHPFDYRNTAQLIFMAGYFLEVDLDNIKHIQMAYSYDLIPNGVGWETRGTHELSLVINLDAFNFLQPNARTPNYRSANKCFDFYDKGIAPVF